MGQTQQSQGSGGITKGGPEGAPVVATIHALTPDALARLDQLESTLGSLRKETKLHFRAAVSSLIALTAALAVPGWNIWSQQGALRAEMREAQAVASKEQVVAFQEFSRKADSSISDVKVSLRESMLEFKGQVSTDFAKVSGQIAKIESQIDELRRAVLDRRVSAVPSGPLFPENESVASVSGEISPNPIR